MKYGKKYADSLKAYDRSKTYDVNEAMALVIDTAKAKFDETIELHVRLGVDPRQADQQVRGVLVLPNGTGKTKRVLVIAKGERADIAKDAGADYVGAEEMIGKDPRAEGPHAEPEVGHGHDGRRQGDLRGQGR